ncbi:DUF1772 domain-containing protein [Nocardioides panacisoli]|uniref:DUF1772 domain-containing protein n=1 Tax=Nocardioides panacisoli TaxID=627624 RepID=A0ABP7I767_9ACTN
MDEFVLVSARILNGLLAGIYAAFLLAVMPALHSQTDEVFAEVMNRINVVIVNPPFLVLFLGAPLAAAVLLRWDHGALGITAAGCAVAALVVTFAANLPLNDALADGVSRSDFEVPWIVWHCLRTATAVAAFGLLCRTPAQG